MKAKVYLLDYTKDADAMLIFTKNTRHLDDPGGLESIKKEHQGYKDAQLEYVFNTISGCWEFVDYTFLITGVTRAFTHQLVRHRVGVAFAQQSLRLPAEGRKWDYLATGKCNPEKGYPESPDETLDGYEYDIPYSYYKAISKSFRAYEDLVRNGADAQDARGVLPTNVLTNIMMKINLRALSEMTHVRLCVRAQGEFQDVVKQLVALAVEVHPFVEPVMGPECVVKGVCKFPRFDGCPIKARHTFLQRGTLDGIKRRIREDWSKFGGFSPQPKKA
jgi:flavin-dependent thymidylate synthase